MPPEIHFENESPGHARFDRPLSHMTRWVIAAGLAKDERSAQYVLLGIAILSLAAAFLIPTFFSASPSRVPQAQIDAGFRSIPPANHHAPH